MACVCVCAITFISRPYRQPIAQVPQSTISRVPLSQWGRHLLGFSFLGQKNLSAAPLGMLVKLGLAGSFQFILQMSWNCVSNYFSCTIILKGVYQIKHLHHKTTFEAKSQEWEEMKKLKLTSFFSHTRNQANTDECQGNLQRPWTWFDYLLSPVFLL